MNANAPALVEAVGLDKTFDARTGIFGHLFRKRDFLIHALSNVNFRITRGETLGLIGESGCGKSTLARVLLRLHEPSAGRILFDGENIVDADAARMKALRRRMQIIFQDPYASLNPRKTVEQIVGLPVRLHLGLGAREARDRVADMLERVGLSAAHLNRFPHQFSGGQRQRIGVARALIVNPEFVVCDEAVSALDVSIQAQILHLLQDLGRDLKLTFLFISHNLSVVGYVSDRIAVMYLGEIVEVGAARDILLSPRHPYTQSLLVAVPRIDGRPRTSQRLGGDPPSPLRPPPGCRFHTRCPHATDRCRTTAPRPVAVGAGHTVACHLFGDGASASSSTGVQP